MCGDVTTYVGIRELKARLSEYLDRAAGGETIVVTHRGKAKAEIRSLSVEERIQQGIREGWITPAERRRSQPVVPLRLKGKLTVDEVMAEDRDE
jgi:prevent-host-death family protein